MSIHCCVFIFACCPRCSLSQDPELLGDALAFHRLSAAYMLRLASPAAAAGGPPSLPLPDPPAKDFCVLPVGGWIAWGARERGRWLLHVTVQC